MKQHKLLSPIFLVAVLAFTPQKPQQILKQLAVFIPQTYNASSDHFNLSCIKTGERRIIRLDDLNHVVRL